MPNLAEVEYKCVGDSKEVRTLYKILQRMNRRKKPKHPNGWGGTLWLGELVSELGFDWRKYRCRGEIIDFQIDGDVVLNIYQSTAWCEQEGVRECIQKKFPSITVHWRVEEPGCEVFQVSSFEHFADRYFLDSYEEPMYFKNITDAAKHVSGIVGHEVEVSVEAITEALDGFIEEKDDDDTWFSFHEFEEVQE